jgi:hypothetical protein
VGLLLGLLFVVVVVLTALIEVAVRASGDPMPAWLRIGLVATALLFLAERLLTWGAFTS